MHDAYERSSLAASLSLSLSPSLSPHVLPASLFPPFPRAIARTYGYACMDEEAYQHAYASGFTRTLDLLDIAFSPLRRIRYQPAPISRPGNERIGCLRSSVDSQLSRFTIRSNAKNSSRLRLGLINRRTFNARAKEFPDKS